MEKHTMNRNTVTVPVVKARNPLVAATLFRKAGQHRKSNKSLRKQENQKLRDFRI